jgi:gliding motility-associated-like protein
MNFRLYKIHFFTLLLLLTSFGALVAQTADNTKGCFPLSVNFTAPTGAATWFWDFKDGGSSNLQNPSNIFTSPGVYAVDFKNTPNGAVVGTIEITVWPKPDVMIASVPSSGCVPLSVKFEDITTADPSIIIQTRSWVFGDGGSAVGNIMPIHTYTTAGSFTVSLELTTNYPSCNITKVFSDRIKTSIKPIPAFSTNPNPPQACLPPLSVSISNASTGLFPLSYNWDFGNGNTSTNVTPNAQNYTQTGSFPITLVVTDALGCSATTQTNVVVGNPPANFTIPDTVCLNTVVQINNTSPPGVYNWSFGPNGVLVGTLTSSPKVQFTATGNQQVTLSVTAGGCTGTTTKTVYVDAADASFSLVPNYSCAEPAIFALNALSPIANQWQWSLPYNKSSILKNPTYTWINPDTTGYTSLGPFMDSIELIAINPTGCIDRKRQKITIWRPNARFTPDKVEGCAPLTVVFTDKSFSNETINQWTWRFGDGSPNMVQNNGSNVSHTFTQPGEYEVELIIRNTAGCIDTSYKVVIQVGIPLTGDFNASKLSICPGDSITFNSLSTDPRIDAWHFYSDSDRQWHCFQNQNPTWTYGYQAGPMDVSLMLEYNGCYNTITKEDYIELKGPIAKLHYKTTCANTLSFDFLNESTGATQIQWSLGDSTLSTLSQLTHLYDSSGTYQVILTAENATSGCPASKDTAIVYATQLKSDFELPYYICGGQPYDLSGATSTGVNASCYKGYTWYFDFQRPIRTEDVVTPFTFSDNGIHEVALEVEDINGCKDTIRQDIKVFLQYPKFDISDTVVCLPVTLQFSDFSSADTTLSQWSWDFGDGSPASNTANTSHTYTTLPPGTDSIIVTLTVTDTLGCSNSIERKITIYKPTSQVFISPSSTVCEDKLLTMLGTEFSGGTSGLSWSWDFGDGSATETGQVVNHAYTQHGTYMVTMTYTEIETGCKDEIIKEVKVQSYPEASFVTNVDNINIICYPQNLQLTNTSTTNYPVNVTWVIANGQLAFGNTTATVFPKGTYPVQMIATTSYGCADTTERFFTVVGPEGNFAMDKNSICVGDIINFNLLDTVDISSFSWSFGDGTTADNINPVSHQYNFLPPLGSTVAKLILRGEDDACTFTIDKPINFSQVNAAFSTVQDPVCLGLPHQFVNTSTDADQWQWSFGDGNSANDTAPTYEYSTDGQFTVTLVVTDLPLGCKDTIVQQVNVAGLPNFEAIGTTVCKGDTATIGLLNPVPGATYTWTPAASVLSPQNSPTVQVVPQATTTYAVSVTVAGTGCMDSDTALVFVPGFYQGATDLDTLIDKNEPVTLPFVSDPLYNFVWQPIPPAGMPIVVQYDGTDTLIYNLKVTDKFGCLERNFTFIIRVFPQDIQVPNAFTPDNGDDTNDVFAIIPDGEMGLIDVNYLRIYNRWGQKIFEGQGTDSTVAWDGLVDGKPAPMDVYIWQASVTFKSGRVQVLTGEVTLIR